MPPKSPKPRFRPRSEPWINAGPLVLILRMKCPCLPCLAGAKHTPPCCVIAVTNHIAILGDAVRLQEVATLPFYMIGSIPHIEARLVISCYIHSHHDIAILDIAIVT